MLRDVFPVVISAITLGSIYALMSMGLALVWGGLRVLNLTQGALFMFGAYTALTIGKAGMPPVVGLIVAFLAMGLIGVVIYAGPIRMLAHRPDRENAILLVTIGLAIVLENIALLEFGPRNRAVPELVEGVTRIGGVVVTWNAVMMTGVAIGLLSLIGAALKWTRLGLSIRALAQQPDGAQLAGIGRDTTFILVMFLSSGIAGVGGVMLSSYYFVTPYVGQTYLLTALIVTILGGLGSLSGTLAAAYLVGFVQAFVSFYLGVRWSLPMLFALIIVMLIVRPGGIAGKSVTGRL